MSKQHLINILKGGFIVYSIAFVFIAFIKFDLLFFLGVSELGEDQRIVVVIIFLALFIPSIIFSMLFDEDLT